MRSMRRTAALFCIESMLVHNILYARANMLCSNSRREISDLFLVRHLDMYINLYS